MRRRLHASLLLLPALVLAPVLAGCGSSDKTSSAAPPTAAAKPQDFPKGTGLTYDDFRSKYPEQLAIAIGASVMRQGTNRIPFLILDKGAKPVTDAPVALYTARGDGTGVKGPFVAHEQSFDIKPAYLSKTTQSDPDQHKSFYVAEVPFKGRAPQAVFGMVKQDGRLVGASPSPLGVKLE